MNMDIVKGRWSQIKGDVRRTFGKLTDDDMMKLEGDLTKASGIIQERYGVTHEEAEKRWKEFISRFSGILDTLTHGGKK